MSATFDTYRIAAANVIRTGTSANGNDWTLQRVILTAPSHKDGPAPCMIADTFEEVPPVGSTVGVVIETERRMIRNRPQTDYRAVSFVPVA